MLWICGFRNRFKFSVGARVPLGINLACTSPPLRATHHIGPNEPNWGAMLTRAVVACFKCDNRNMFMQSLTIDSTVA